VSSYGTWFSKYPRANIGPHKPQIPVIRPSDHHVAWINPVCALTPTFAQSWSLYVTTSFVTVSLACTPRRPRVEGQVQNADNDSRNGQMV
jgi:hypothetical protein